MSATDWIIIVAIVCLTFLGAFVLFKEQIIERFKKVNCCHEWEQYNVQKAFTDEHDSMPYKVTHTLICKKCGKIKQINASI